MRGSKCFCLSAVNEFSLLSFQFYLCASGHILISALEPEADGRCGAGHISTTGLEGGDRNQTGRQGGQVLHRRQRRI